jgi:hypothetical protein
MTQTKLPLLSKPSSELSLSNTDFLMHTKTKVTAIFLMQMLQDTQSSKHAHANMNRSIILQAMMPTPRDPQSSTTVSISLGFEAKLPYDHNDPPASNDWDICF